MYDYEVLNRTLNRILMSGCFDHKTTFPDTHRHFRPAIDISMKFPIACGGQSSNNATFKQNDAWTRSLCMTFLKCSISGK